MKRALLFALLAAPAWADDAIPLFFIANHGQAPPRVRFMAQGSGLTAFFSPDQVLFRLADTSIALRFEGATPARVEGAGPLAATANFLSGDESAWRTAVPLYGAIVYRNLYPGIDMVYNGDRRNLKSEL